MKRLELRRPWQPEKRRAHSGARDADAVASMKIKVHGAGSIGNHLSHAARRLGWSVDLIDIDPAALERARDEIYPARYGSWDERHRSVHLGRGAQGRLRPDPGRHAARQPHAARAATRSRRARAPFSSRSRSARPICDGADELIAKAKAKGCRLFVGYDHVVGAAAERFCALIDEGRAGEVQTLDVEFREHWGGIFAAHPWLSGPVRQLSRLLAARRWRGGEHSHAFNLWQHFAHRLGQGRVSRVTANLDYVEEDGVELRPPVPRQSRDRSRASSAAWCRTW